MHVCVGGGGGAGRAGIDFTKMIQPITKQINSENNNKARNEDGGGPVPKVAAIYYLKYPFTNEKL